MTTKIMRDVVIESITELMKDNSSIFFVAADFGSPKLDRLREEFPDRFLNVGIAEQNLINVSTGLALEGYTVFAYAIAPFISMRCYEQIRVNLAILSQLKPLNVNLIGVGAGFSYDMAGPSHQALEDLSIMRTLPNIEVFSPADWVCAEAYIEYAVQNQSPAYIRLDGKPLPSIYPCKNVLDINQGFHELKKGESICLISTGYMTQKVYSMIQEKKIDDPSIGLIDLYLLKNLNQDRICESLQKYSQIITLEEGFINKGGLDSLIQAIIRNNQLTIPMTVLGIQDSYNFDIGGREFLHSMNQLSEKHIIKQLHSTSI
jgi:transketolase